MKIQINIKKEHAILFLGIILVVAIVVAYGTNNPSSFGHTSSEIFLANIGSPQNLDSWSNSIDVQVNSNTNNINTIQTSYCRQDGTHCPTSIPPQYNSYAVPNNVPCPVGTTALICVKSPGAIAGFGQSNSYQPYWVSGQWRLSTSGSGVCDKVICG